MSRIYSNDPLSALPVNTIEWKGAWPPSPPVSQPPNRGVLIEGTIISRSRIVISDEAKSRTRYFVLHVKIRRAHRRVFDGSGKEAEPNFSETEKIRTGYLHSSYKSVAKGKTDLLSFDELVRLVTMDGLSRLTAKDTQAGCIALWILESELAGQELENNDEVRVKTTGSGSFIQNIAKLDAVSSVVCNYAGGEQVGANWTDKVFAVKSAKDDTSSKNNTKDNEGAADDEWD